MHIKIFNLNLKGFWNREKRKSLIIKSIQKHSPDIITFQEIQEQKNISQIDELNEVLKYKNTHFATCFNDSKDYGKGVLTNSNINEGLGIMANEDFDMSTIKLPIRKGIDRRPRIAVQYAFENFTLTNIHFSNKGIESTIPQWKNTPQSDIIIGDFNMKPKELIQIQGNYISSYDFQPYISYPSEGNTFDYCLLKKGHFTSIQTIDNLSDHTGLLFEVALNK